MCSSAGVSKFCVYYFLLQRAELVAIRSSKSPANLHYPSQWAKLKAIIVYQCWPITFEKMVVNSTFLVIPIALVTACVIQAIKVDGLCLSTVPLPIAAIVILLDVGTADRTTRQQT